jgi:hypothetical protein
VNPSLAGPYTPVDQVTVTFSEAVTGLSGSDFVLERDGQAITLTGVTFSSSDMITWTLGGLSVLTDRAGSYALAVLSGPGITDLASNPLASTAGAGWQMCGVRGTNGNDTIDICRSGTLISITVNGSSCTVNPSGLSDLLVDGGGGDDQLRLSGAAAIGLAVDFIGGVGNDAWIFAGSGISRTFTADICSCAETLAVGNAAAVTFAASQRLAFLEIASGGVVTAAPGGGHTIVADALTVEGGNLDLADNDLIVRAGTLGSWNGSAYTGISGLVQSGRNGGTWDGFGIGTSMSEAQSGYTTLAVASAADVLGISPTQTALWGTETVNGAAVLIKYTYGGDANLDGQVDVEDYSVIDASWGTGAGGGGSFLGDFNLDGVIDIDDYGMIDFCFPIQGLEL